MKKLTIRATITRESLLGNLERIRIIDSSRCLFFYDNKNLSVLIYDIQGGEAKVGKKASCEIDFLNGSVLSSLLSKGDAFKLVLANKVIAKGTVEDIISC